MSGAEKIGFWKCPIADYPAIYKHLLEYRKSLEGRNVAETGIRYEWYALQRCAATYWQEINQPKIFLQIIKKDHGFAYSEIPFFSNDKSSICIGDEATLAILNSRVIEWVCKTDFPSLGDTAHGGRVEYRPNLVTKLPIPPATPEDKTRLTALAVACAEATRKQDAAALATLEAEINRIVYRLFALTPAEIALIESSRAT